MEVLGKENANYICFSFLTSLSVLPSLPSLYFIFLIFLTYKGIRGSTCIIVYEMFSVMEIFLFVNFLMGFCLNFFFNLHLFFSLGPQSPFLLCFLIFFLIFTCLSIPSFWFFSVLLLSYLSFCTSCLIFSQVLSVLKSPSYHYCTPYPPLLLQSKPFSFI